jgi:hypothetical protein
MAENGDDPRWSSIDLPQYEGTAYPLPVTTPETLTLPFAEQRVAKEEVSLEEHLREWRAHCAKNLFDWLLLWGNDLGQNEPYTVGALVCHINRQRLNAGSYACVRRALHALGKLHRLVSKDPNDD